MIGKYRKTILKVQENIGKIYEKYMKNIRKVYEIYNKSIGNI